MSVTEFGSVSATALLQMEARARAGLPEPGQHFCSWCHGPATVFLDPVDGRIERQTARFICPCCSVPGCEHGVGQERVG